MINDIGYRIKQLMILKNISSQDLGDYLGCTRQCICRKIKYNNFSLSELQEIADYLGADLLIDFVLVD